MRAPQSTFAGILNGEAGKGLLKKGGAMIFWQVVTLGLSFISSVWIARCLGPEELGKSGFILATGNQILLILSVCPNVYAVRLLKREKNSSFAISLIVTSRMLFCVVYLLVISILLLLGAFPDSWRHLVFLGMAVPVILAFQPVWLLQSQENQAAQYKSSAMIALGSALYAIAFIRPHDVASEDLIAKIIGLLLGLFLAWRLTGKGNPVRYFKLSRIGSSFSEVWKSKALFITQIVIYIYVGLEVPLLGYLATVEDLGMYRTATQLAMAVNSIVAIVPIILYPRFIEWHNESPTLLWKNQKRICWVALWFVIPGCVVSLFLGPWIFESIFGSAFQNAGFPFALLVCSKLVVLLGGIFAWGLWAQSKDIGMLILYLVVALTSLALNLALIPRFGMNAAAGTNLFSQVFIFALAFWFAWKKSGDENRIDGLKESESSDQA